MPNKDNHIYDKQTRTWFDVTPEQFREYDRWRTRIRKREQAHGHCMCPRSKWWLCDGMYQDCEFHAAGDTISLDAPVGEDGESTVGDFLAVSEDAAPESRTLMNALSEDMRKELSTLTERERIVICMRFGLFDGRERTLEEVGESFLVTRERIRQIEAKALRKLRHPARSRYLCEYIVK